MAGVAMQPLASEIAFRTAEELSSKEPAQQRRTVEELESRIAAQDELIERQVRKIMALEGSNGKSSAKSEDLKLLEELRDLLKDQKADIKAIKTTVDNKVVKQEETIDKLSREISNLQKELHDVKDLSKIAIAEVRNRQNVDRKNINELEDIVTEVCQKIGEHAALINKVSQAVKKNYSEPRGRKTIERLEKLTEILKSGPRTFGEVEKQLKITPKEMNRLVSKLDMRKFKISPRPGNGREKVIRLKAWSGQSLTSNVKCSAEGLLKGS